MAQKINKTNAARLLDKAKIPYDCSKVYSCLVDNANVEFKVLGKNLTIISFEPQFPNINNV